MKKLVFVLGIALMLSFMLTITALANEPTYVSGFFYTATAPYDFCYATGENYVKDNFIDGCGYYITAKNGFGQTAIWDGWVDGNYGTCVIHARTPINMDDPRSHVAINQCTGDLAGLHMVADGEFTTFTWEGWYQWDMRGQ